MEIVWMDGGGSWPTSCPDSAGDLGSGERGAEPKREEHGRDGGESGHNRIRAEQIQAEHVMGERINEDAAAGGPGQGSCA
jgi:hypothetical protein